ncbi:DUF6745 domain-containing protein [Allocoleopsis sp.]|uniref:DUF6745 domain-containing protein n=1 Tax=Allocoleopsis sp. TaxID=3088169 RepID=UPI002FD3BFD0
MPRITRLTAKQEALLQVYRQKWINIARNTQQIDPQKATRTVHNFYAAFAQPEPQVLCFKGASSALADALAYQLKWRWLIYGLEYFLGILSLLSFILFLSPLLVPSLLLTAPVLIIALMVAFLQKIVPKSKPINQHWILTSLFIIFGFVYFIYFIWVSSIIGAKASALVFPMILSAGAGGLGLLILNFVFHRARHCYQLAIRCVSKTSKRQRQSSRPLALYRAFASWQKDSALSFDRRSFCLGWLQFQVNEIGYQISPEIKRHLWCELVGYQQIGEIRFAYATREWLKFEQWDSTRQQMLRQLLSHSRRANSREQVLMEVLVDPGYLMPYLCWLDFCISELGCQHDEPRWQAFCELIQACGWVIPGRNICWVCDRPLRLSLDEQYRLHAEGEPAVEFADGFQMYAYQGVELPPRYTLAPHKWKSSWLLQERNAELRRVLIQGIGYERICRELQATQLDTWREYTLLRINTHSDIEPFALLQMTCPSTGHTHIIRVPPEIQFARQAVRWVNWDIDAQDFAVET